MKKLLLIVFILLCVIKLNAQQAEYDKFDGDREKIYDSYISKSGDKLQVGDTLIIGTASGSTVFRFLQQGGKLCSPTIAGRKIIITQIRTYKHNLFFQFKGFGWLPCFITYEPAITAKEIINPKAQMTSSEALLILKTEKDKLDLGLITKEQFETKKQELSKYIK